MTQKDLARKIKLSVGTIQQYELGKRNPSYETLEKIANALGTTQPYLLGWDDIAKVTIDQNGDTIIDPLYKKQLKKIERAFDILNVYGRDEVVNFAFDLTKVGRYTKPIENLTENDFPELFDEYPEDNPKLDSLNSSLNKKGV